MAATQTQEDTDKGYIVELIEDSLSGGSRDVNIIDFQGALSSVASIDVLTIADTDGVWLTLEDVALDWNRSALLTGRIDVNALRADRIIVARPPVSEGGGPAPEATPFSLPELPVGISLGDLDIAQITLGAPFLGEEISFQITGNAALASGEGTANITATRLGDKQGLFEISGGYSNETRILDLLLNLQEGRNGIAATLLGLPGAPSTALTIAGTAPIDAYAAKITLATDNTDRVAGDFAMTNDADGRLISLNLGGDVTPLFAPEYQSFFGLDTTLNVVVGTGQSGEIDLRDLELTSDAIALTGTAQIGAQGWPARVNLRGQITGADGDPVLLPLSGPKTYVSDMTLVLGYDAALSSDWSMDMTLNAFERPGMFLQQVNLAGGGALQSGEGARTGSISADLTYQAQGIALDDTALSEALGTQISGVINATRTEGEPARITRLTVDGPGVELVADATLSGVTNRLRVQSNALVSARDIGRFSTLAGRPLSGSADIAIASTIVPLDGTFDVIVTGETQDLTVDIAQADALLTGKGDIVGVVKRDIAGTRLEALTIRTNAVQLTAEADLQSDGSTARFEINAADIALIEPKLSGAARIIGTANQDADGLLKLAVTGTAPATELQAIADVNPGPTGQTVNFETTAKLDDLTKFAALVGQQIAGATRLDISGTVLSDGQRFVADISGETNNLAFGLAQVDPLLRSQGDVSMAITRIGSDLFSVTDLSLNTDAFTATGDAKGGTKGVANATLRAQIKDASLLGNGLSGTIVAAVDATRDANDMATVNARLTGPQTAITLDADISADQQIKGVVQADIASLATYSTLIGQPVSGGISARIAGNMRADMSAFAADFDIQTDDLGIGNATADLLLRGDGALQGRAQLDSGWLSINGLSASTANLTLNGDLGRASGSRRGAFSARLRDVEVFTDQLSGAIDARGTAALDSGGNWSIDATADGPGGIAVRTNGQIGADGRVRLNATGQAPLGLANRIIEPRRVSGDATFDLSVNGQPSLSALSGRIDLQNAQLTVPSLAQGLSNILGGVTIANGRAQIAITGDVKSGGTIAVRGPVTLDAPQTADIAVTLDGVVVKDPELYETSLSGQITLKGPVQGGARIAGDLTLGQTDVQVPSSGVGALGDLPNVTHVGASGAIKTTLDRAGVSVAGTPAAAPTSTARPFPLDVTINAPSRIFIRGRGLDAELGGTLKIGGTTTNIQPVGLFELARGRIDILQQRFELTEGSASLQGDFEPYIRLVATTQARTGTTISIIVEGPATAPEVSFISTPSLPQDEVLSQLIFGRDLQNISPLQAVQLAAAVGTLAGRGGGGLIDTFRQNVGLDDFDVTTDEDGNAAVRAGKYLSDNVYTDVTVSSDGSTEIHLNLDITDEITAKGTVDADGETSIGIFFERDY